MLDPEKSRDWGGTSRWRRMATMGAVLLLISLLLLWHERLNPPPVAVSKGGWLLESATALELTAAQARARDLALADAELTSLFSGDDYGLVSALPLDTAELRSALGRDCVADNCLRVTFYDYRAGGTVEAVVDLRQSRVLNRLANPSARPAPSAQVLPRALAIAAADRRVQEVLGDIRQAEPMMVPMSVYLTDDDCRRDWCVDLTFLAPDGSGQVFHTVVNMEQEQVARLFYSRARADRAYERPLAQEPRYNDGCHEQYGWSVCWEMTAHDGLNFYDASFQGDSIFSSVKIGQVEVYYPSWPGGYRDEIGFSSSVPPYYGTHVTDLEDGFEVSQLYTEFLSWPNCVCCYRYEQITRFFMDGSFELHFISHGPGCDELPIYRAFWRIDLDLGGLVNNDLWYWEDGAWTEANSEVEMDLFDSLSPENEKLYTAAGDIGYKWFPQPTDPLGLDEGKLVALRWRPFQGEDTIAPGEANTFSPPRAWLDGEELPGRNVVLWYIPILNAIKQEPWWCMPDPEPDFSPCYSLLRAEPASELQPATPVPPTPTGTPGPTQTPTRTPPPAPTSTPRPIAGEDAPSIALNAGCTHCHLIGQIGAAGKVGPDLSYIADVASQRVPGQSAVEYLRNSILDPGAFLAPNCPNGPCLEDVMPQDFGRRLTTEQLDTLVSFLLELSAQPTEEELTRAAESDAGPAHTPIPTSAPLAPDRPVTASALAVLLLSTLVLIAALVVLLVLRSRSGT